MIESHWHLWQGCHQMLHSTLNLPQCTQDLTHTWRRSLLPTYIFILHPLCCYILPCWPQGRSRNPRSGADGGCYADYSNPHLIFCNAYGVLPPRYGWHYQLLAVLFLALLVATPSPADHSNTSKTHCLSHTMGTTPKFTLQATSYAIYITSYPLTTHYTNTSWHCYLLPSLPLPAYHHSIINNTI